MNASTDYDHHTARSGWAASIPQSASQPDTAAPLPPVGRPSTASSPTGAGHRSPGAGGTNPDDLERRAELVGALDRAAAALLDLTRVLSRTAQDTYHARLADDIRASAAH